MKILSIFLVSLLAISSASFANADHSVIYYGNILPSSINEKSVNQPSSFHEVRHFQLNLDENVGVGYDTPPQNLSNQAVDSGSSIYNVKLEENVPLAVNNNMPPAKTAIFSIFDGIKWTTVQSKSTISEQWTHFAATYNGTSISIYVNGTLEGTH